MGGSTIYRTVLNATGNDFMEILIDLSMDRTPTLSTSQPVPTLIHDLWTAKSGRISAISGESRAVQTPSYVEHQFYKDLGDMAYRAPQSASGVGYILLRNQGYDELERDTHFVLQNLQIAVTTVDVKEEVGV